MPHFIVHCSEDILDAMPEHDINKQLHSVANDSGLFTESDIKVRVQSFSTYLVGNKKESFIHIFASIMEGRTIEQRAMLSKSMVGKLAGLFPGVPNIAMNIDEFEKSTYCNKTLLETSD